MHRAPAPSDPGGTGPSGLNINRNRLTATAQPIANLIRA